MQTRTKIPNGPLGIPNGPLGSSRRTPQRRWRVQNAVGGIPRRRWGHLSTPLGAGSTALGSPSRTPQRRWGNPPTPSGRRGVISTPLGKSPDAVEGICRRRWGQAQRRWGVRRRLPNGVGEIPQRRRARPNAVGVPASAADRPELSSREVQAARTSLDFLHLSYLRRN